MVLFYPFINSYTQFRFVYFISHKLEELKCFKQFLNLVDNQKALKTLLTYRGQELAIHLKAFVKVKSSDN